LELIFRVFSLANYGVFWLEETKARRLDFTHWLLAKSGAVYIYSPLEDRGAMKVEIVEYISEFEKEKK